MADINETKKILAAIALAYPGRFKLDPTQLRATLELWAGLLSDLREGAALEACRALVASSAYPPAISEIRSQALSVHLGKGRPEAGDAWGEVTRAIGAVGMNRIPKWSSPAVSMAVAAIGGWRAVCTSENTAADRARFLEHFAGTIEAASRDVLTGKAESIDQALELRAPRADGVAKQLPPAIAELVARIGQ